MQEVIVQQNQSVITELKEIKESSIQHPINFTDIAAIRREQVAC